MNTQLIQSKTFQGERPLFAVHDACLQDVLILPGESALKECSRVEAIRCEFQGKYPFWHNDGLLIKDCLFKEGARAAIWYTRNLQMTNSRVEAPKMFRDVSDMMLENVVLSDAAECCWHCHRAKLQKVHIDHGDYLFMHGSEIEITDLTLNGNYSFQYCHDIVIRNSTLNSKDAFWNTRNVTVYDSILNGEYLGWHSTDIRLVNCHIAGTQSLCYAHNLVLENCTFADDADLCFEYSDVHATIKGHIRSIKNPCSGQITADSCDEVVWDEFKRPPADCIIDIINA